MAVQQAKAPPSPREELLNSTENCNPPTTTITSTTTPKRKSSAGKIAADQASSERCQHEGFFHDPTFGTKTLDLAPMLDVTTREFRYFMRLLSRRMVNWTEMHVDQTILHSDNLDYHLDYCRVEEPMVLQLGGNDPDTCAKATEIIAGEKYQYKHVNLNCGCPSDRVSGKGEFGAVLMKKPETVRDVMQAIAEACKEKNLAVDLSVKTRIGVDDCDNSEFLEKFITVVRESGVRKFILHARKCILKGLTPAQNRSIPPLNYARVFEMCDKFPDCEFWLNGGVKTLRQAKELAYGTATTVEERETAQKRRKTCQKQNEETSAAPGEAARNEGKQEQKVERPSTPVAENVSLEMEADTTSARSEETAGQFLSEYPNANCHPRTHAPANLRGVMLGRAAMENPSIFADADRYYYGDTENPNQTRRQVLDKYCAYLEQLYPPQCVQAQQSTAMAAAAGTPKSTEASSPSTAPEHEQSRQSDGTQETAAPVLQETGVVESCLRHHQHCLCPICRCLYSVPSEQRNDQTSKAIEDATAQAIETLKSSDKEFLALGVKQSRKNRHNNPNVKVSSGCVARCLKPVLGLFCNLPGNKQFRRDLDVFSRDLYVRNCGVAYIIRRCMSRLSNDLLDMPFRRTEDETDPAEEKRELDEKFMAAKQQQDGVNPKDQKSKRRKLAQAATSHEPMQTT
ncbi:unnamed protein product [Amoebophrya sp. A120]|nr:unnamed protein product [Amoebophrya sp. A120]|eukprot:GSA120T00016650001.1